MTAPTFRERYFEALGLDPAVDSDQTKRKAALARAHDLRKFEIELYWKRANYFWAFQAIAFATLGLSIRGGELQSHRIFFWAAALGVVTAFAGWRIARGSKFWQENWEAHVDLLESDIEGRLTQVIVTRFRSPQSSVSQVNQWLLGLLGLCWLFALVFIAFPQLQWILTLFTPVSRGAAALLGVFFICCLMWWLTKSHLAGRSLHVGDPEWMEYSPNKSSAKAWIIWRDPPGGRLPE